MKRTKFFGVLALVIIIAALGTASAFGGNLFRMDPGNREDIVNAIEANDYEVWKETMSDQLTKENFQMLVERHEQMSGMREQREAMKLAIEAEDYEAFQVAAENWPMLSNIKDVGDFEILVRLHQAKLDRDYETVEKLREQLGLPGGFGEHKMPGQFVRGRMI